MNPPQIEVTIDEVILRGVPPEQARAVVAALEARLTELATSLGNEPAVQWAGRTESSRRLPGIDAPADSPAALGTAVADSVWSSVAGAGPGSAP